MKKVICLFMVMLLITGCGKSKMTKDEQKKEKETKEEQAVSIVDVNSNSRPYAVVINNSPVAVKVQTGLQKAFVVYEFPVEGGLTRLLAIYKDIDDLKIGTIRSARHNFLDYAFEYDAILVSFGWSHYAEDDMKSLGINYINGVVHSGPFYRENPEGLATEHTAYTTIDNIRQFADNHSYKNTTDKGLVFKYSAEEINLTKKEHHEIANTITIPAGAMTTTYEYDEANKNYKRIVNGKPNIDHDTKEQFTTKNIIVQKINSKMASDNYYWDLETVGSGEGYYITNGYAVPITWTKDSRTSKTVYQYQDGTEITLNDGNTYVQLQTNRQNLSIE